MAQGQLCGQKTVEEISAARISIENYLRATFEEIGQLQKESEFLQNVEKIQTKTDTLETWKVQREQLLAAEDCAKACTCDEGTRLVLQEYNNLIAQAGPESGLNPVTLPLTQTGWIGVGVLAIVMLAAVIVIWRRRRA